jgi:hypothetical protein
MADVIDTLELLEELVFVVEVRTLPVDVVPGRGFEAAFSHGREQ